MSLTTQESDMIKFENDKIHMVSKFELQIKLLLEENNLLRINKEELQA